VVDGSHRLFIDNDRESTGIVEDCSVYWGTQIPCRTSIYRSFRVVNENPESRIRWSRVGFEPRPPHNLKPQVEALKIRSAGGFRRAKTAPLSAPRQQSRDLNRRPPPRATLGASDWPPNDANDLPNGASEYCWGLGFPLSRLPRPSQGGRYLGRAAVDDDPPPDRWWNPRTPTQP
jgi:hypothetical protein